MNPPSYTLPQNIHHRLRRIQLHVLNDHTTHQPTPTSTLEIITLLKQCINRVEAAAFDMTSGKVDYTGLKTSPAYADFRALSPLLAKIDLTDLQSESAQMAFWINLYNILVIDAVIHENVNNIDAIPAAFLSMGYNVGGNFYSLQDIEQGILRANAGYPGFPGPQFGKNDPRRQFVMPNLDPRIHFTLVCAAESCPPIAVYDADQLAHQLEIAARNFINSSDVEIDMARKTVHLSKIFLWYAPDFGAPFAVKLGFGDASAILRWIAPYLMDDDKRDFIQNHSNTVKIVFKAYDWHLNASQ